MPGLFNLNDRNGRTPAMKTTLDRMNSMFSRNARKNVIKSESADGSKRAKITKLTKQLKLLSNPLIIRSDPTPGKVPHPAPYFLNKDIDFLTEFSKAIKDEKNCMFFIIANNFIPQTATFQSHMLMGFFDAKEKNLKIIDPNGNDVSLDNIYSGSEFIRMSGANDTLKNPIRNPLYNTLFRILRYYYDENFFKLEFYTGEPIICPIGHFENCSYRTVMIMLGFMSSSNLDVKKALEKANYLARHKFQEVKDMLEKIVRSNSNAEDVMKEIIDDDSLEKLDVKFLSI
jgi:hypothetical protein